LKIFLKSLKKNLNKLENCIFCQIIKGSIPAKKIFEDEDILAFDDIAPKAPVHFLVIPKKHLSTVSDMQEEDQKLFGKMIFKAQDLAKKKD